MRLLEPDSDLSVTGEILEDAVLDDRSQGLIPICCVATLGTTSSCAFDDIQTLGPVCQDQVRTFLISFIIITFNYCWA